MKDTQIFSVDEIKITIIGQGLSPHGSWKDFAITEESEYSEKLLKKYNSLSKSQKKTFDNAVNDCFINLKPYLSGEDFVAEVSTPIIEDSIEEFFYDFLE